MFAITNKLTWGGQIFHLTQDKSEEEKNNLAGRVEDVVAEKGKLAKKVADLEARAKESESMLKETELQATAEREAIKKLEDELLIFKREAMEHHEKGFNKVVR